MPEIQCECGPVKDGEVTDGCCMHCGSKLNAKELPDDYWPVENDDCPYCEGIMVKDTEASGCSCHINPPCAYCTAGFTCTVCDFSVEGAQ